MQHLVFFSSLVSRLIQDHRSTLKTQRILMDCLLRIDQAAIDEDFRGYLYPGKYHFPTEYLQVLRQCMAATDLKAGSVQGLVMLWDFHALAQQALREACRDRPRFFDPALPKAIALQFFTCFFLPRFLLQETPRRCFEFLGETCHSYCLPPGIVEAAQSCLIEPELLFPASRYGAFCPNSTDLKAMDMETLIQHLFIRAAQPRYDYRFSFLSTGPVTESFDRFLEASMALSNVEQWDLDRAFFWKGYKTQVLPLLILRTMAPSPAPTKTQRLAKRTIEAHHKYLNGKGMPSREGSEQFLRLLVGRFMGKALPSVLMKREHRATPQIREHFQSKPGAYAVFQAAASTCGEPGFLLFASNRSLDISKTPPGYVTQKTKDLFKLADLLEAAYD